MPNIKPNYFQWNLVPGRPDVPGRAVAGDEGVEDGLVEGHLALLRDNSYMTSASADKVMEVALVLYCKSGANAEGGKRTSYKDGPFMCSRIDEALDMSPILQNLK